MKFKKGMRLKQQTGKHNSNNIYKINRVRISCAGDDDMRCSNCKGELWIENVKNNRKKYPCVKSINKNIEEGLIMILNNSIRRLN